MDQENDSESLGQTEVISHFSEDLRSEIQAVTTLITAYRAGRKKINNHR